MAVITRPLALASTDLGHFFFVMFIIFVGYAAMAHILFGYTISEFATFGASLNECFELLLGEMGVTEKLFALEGGEAVPAVLFFWSYEILVFLILLNFMLAIIVDAFAD